MQLNPQIIAKEGKEEFVVLPVEQYRMLIALVDDYEDLRDLRAAKEASKAQQSIPIDQAVLELGL